MRKSTNYGIVSRTVIEITGTVIISNLYAIDLAEYILVLTARELLLYKNEADNALTTTIFVFALVPEVILLWRLIE